MKKVSNLLILIGLLTMFLIGCNSENKSDAASKQDVEVENKTLTYATSIEVDNLTSLKMSPENNITCKLVYNTLVNYEDGEIKPMLATSFSFNEDGTELTLKLREDVTFHNGEVFNAEAVKKNLEFYHLNPNAGFMLAAGNLEYVEVVDDFTCVLHFPTPYFAYLNDLCQPDVMVMVEPSMIEEGNFQTMRGTVGTGPYIYDELVSGEYVRFVKNENYWGDLSDYAYDEIIVKYIHEDTTRLQAIQNGEVDMLYNSSFLTYDDYQQGLAISGVKGELSEKYAQTRGLAVNASLPVLSDVRVREAIEHAINRQEIVLGLTYDLDDVAYDMYPKDLSYTNVPSIKRDYDIEKSKTLLDEAGYLLNEQTGIREKDGQPLSFTLTYDSGDVVNKPLVTVIQSQLMEVGIQTETVGLDMFTWWMGAVEGDYGLTVWNIPLDAFTVPHLNMTPWINSTPQTPTIYALEDGEECMAYIQEFMVTKDEKRVQEIFEYLIMYSDKHVINIPLTYSKEYMLYREDSMKGYEFTDTPKYFEADDVIQ